MPFGTNRLIIACVSLEVVGHGCPSMWIGQPLHPKSTLSCDGFQQTQVEDGAREPRNGGLKGRQGRGWRLPLEISLMLGESRKAMVNLRLSQLGN